MNRFYYKVLALFLTFGLVLTACVFPEKENPFDSLPEDSLETISGMLFPFSASISTKATHRLEDDGRLVGYIVSDIVQLSEFEGRRVELDGIWDREKMRQIFLVQAIRIKTLEDITEEQESENLARFKTKGLTFSYPSNWSYSLDPQGVAYFLDKNDPLRKVFFTFRVEDYSPEEPESEKIIPNILMNGFAGIKKVSSTKKGEEQEKVLLFSNLFNKRYIFEIQYNFDDFETKKSFLDVLNSFIEGEESIQKVIELEKKELADKELQKVEQLELLELAEEQRILEQELKNRESDSKSEEEETPSKPSETASEETLEEDQEITSDYNNVLDDNASYYESRYYGFSMKVPFGYWYRNFGPGGPSLAEVGFSKDPIEGRESVDFWMYIVNEPTDSEEIKVTASGEESVQVIRKRDGYSVFKMEGPKIHLDAIQSIIRSITIF